MEIQSMTAHSSPQSLRAPPGSLNRAFNEVTKTVTRGNKLLIFVAFVSLVLAWKQSLETIEACDTTPKHAERRFLFLLTLLVAALISTTSVICAKLLRNTLLLQESSATFHSKVIRALLIFSLLLLVIGAVLMGLAARESAQMIIEKLSCDAVLPIEGIIVFALGIFTSVTLYVCMPVYGICALSIVESRETFPV